ncbi:histidinol dehydrogenase [Desulfovibrio litoralis]|uniref:Sulfopropanediol 3-dehydrogenase n=1 Tax=Desulfovibrio litoralis DSM 11393 TaxID=1121455 RepID=A0A1M7TBR1_9BACT|nr:histidinol dehydrogenase [Desulfovibrio litoralis]SHN68107.1 sulfopropanediol 3-dehydrogenase [Desulfovibrio litoralis DSM 11393]
MEYLKKAGTSAEEFSNTARKVVEEILADIRANGEEAVRQIAKKFDKWDQDFVLSPEKKAKLIAKVSEEQKKDIRFAYEQVLAFAQAQRDSIKDFDIVTPAGVRAGQKVVPMDVAGCYIPGGRFAHTCSALMSIVTAKVAGVPFVVAATPPRGDSIDASVCYAMDIAGADIILEMGGVQAVATMAYGLFTGRKANIITGPGNAYVAECKAILAGEGVCGIDLFAGPSEIAVLADKNADPMTVAIDLLSQGEHGTNSPVWLFTDSRELGEKVIEIMPKLIADMPDPATPLKSWEDYGEVILCKDKAEMIKISDTYAPEHLEVLCDDLNWWLANLTSYGSLFMGEMSTVTHGDKCAGPNHILPTKKAAHFSGGLNVHKYLKILTYQEPLTLEACNTVSEYASRLSRLEGMEGHARACDWRLTKLNPNKKWNFPVYVHPKY